MNWIAAREQDRIRRRRHRQENRGEFRKAFLRTAAFVVAVSVVSFVAGCGEPAAPEFREALRDSGPSRLAPDHVCRPGTIHVTRRGDILEIHARANDPFENGFEGRALEIDAELPPTLDVVGVTVGYPVSTWWRSGWRQYVHPVTEKPRLVILAAKGTDTSAAAILPGQSYLFARLEIHGAGVPTWEHLVDGFAGYTVCGRY